MGLRPGCFHLGLHRFSDLVLQLFLDSVRTPGLSMPDVVVWTGSVANSC